MKVHINVEQSLEEMELTIDCPQRDQKVEKILAMLQVMDKKLTGTKDGHTYILDAGSILYIDTVDKRSFFYTKTDVYETPLKLYELEEQLAELDFFRAGKSCIINFNQIKSLKPDLDGRILVTMANEEKVFVSRQYAATIKMKLGVK